MKKSRYNEEQIIGVLKRMEAGQKAREPSRHSHAGLDHLAAQPAGSLTAVTTAPSLPRATSWHGVRNARSS